MTNPTLTHDRIERIFRLCGSPMRASRASERIYMIAHRTETRGAQARDRELCRTARRLHYLSDALHEQRHVLLSTAAGNATEATRHSTARDGYIVRAMGGAS
jgi:hypothetical protein